MEDWERFKKYSSRVKSFRYDCANAKTTKTISRDVLHAIAQTRPISHVFPNSKQLIWRPRLSNLHRHPDHTWKDTDALLFMHPGIESFKLRLLNASVARTRFLSDIPYRMPNLTHIEVTTKLQFSSVDDDLCRLVTELPQLKWVTLPACYLSARLFEALSKLSALEKLDDEYAEESLPGQPYIPALPPLEPIDIRGGFDSLHYLEVMRTYDDASSLVRHTPKLKTLYVASKHVWETAQSLQTLLDVASDRCKSIEDIYFISMPDRHSLRSRLGQMLGSNSASIPPITFKTLQPLTQMPALVELDIADTAALTMSLSELETLLSSLPHLKALHLNPSPLRLNESSFGLEIIPAVGRHCKEIQEFSAFFDATRPIPLTSAVDAATLFPALVQLCVSVSIITQEVQGDVAIYLSDILPKKCKLSIIGTEWPGKIDDREGTSISDCILISGSLALIGQRTLISNGCKLS